MDTAVTGLVNSLAKRFEVNAHSFEAFVYPPNYKSEFLFHGLVKSISSTNSEGAFDILPMHENFVTTLRDKVVIVDDKDKTHEFNVGRAVLEASENLVKVFVEF